MAEPLPDSAETLQLLEQLWANQAVAFEQLHARYADFLCRIVELRMDTRLRSRIDPSDVVQESLLDIARRLRDYLQRRPMPFRLWLRKTVQERLIKLECQHLAAKRRAVGREVSLPDNSSMMLAQRLQSAGLSPSAQLTQAEIVERVQRALARLHNADREVLLMRDFEGLSNTEIAYLMGLNAEAVSKRHGRALLRLHKLLHEEGLEGTKP
jgi:RNA polymerase sigma-70 factor (ECF subfamily)